MPWQVSFNSELRIINVSYAGHVTAADLGQAIQAGINVGLQHGSTRCLTDCRQMVDGHSLFDLLDSVNVLVDSQHLLQVKEAVLMSSSARAAEFVLFWETACRNRGLNVKVFTDRDAAIAWLCG